MILAKIVEQKKREVNELIRSGVSLPKAFVGREIGPPRGFKKSLVQYPAVAVIAEIKKASPSKGVICEDFNPVAIAANYQKNGAQALSVLTDKSFFQGNLQALMQVRETVPLPVIRKDFIIHEIQVTEACLHGADAILLIAAILDAYQLRDLAQQAAEAEVDSLVEVHNEAELDRALSAGADLIGINNRNLNDFRVDLQTTFRLKSLIGPDIPVVSESGIKTADQIQMLDEHGITAALIGESLMRAGADSDFLAQLRAGKRSYSKQ